MSPPSVSTSALHYELFVFITYLHPNLHQEDHLHHILPYCDQPLYLQSPEMSAQEPEPNNMVRAYYTMDVRDQIAVVKLDGSTLMDSVNQNPMAEFWRQLRRDYFEGEKRTENTSFKTMISAMLDAFRWRQVSSLSLHLYIHWGEQAVELQEYLLKALSENESNAPNFYLHHSTDTADGGIPVTVSGSPYTTYPHELHLRQPQEFSSDSKLSPYGIWMTIKDQNGHLKGLLNALSPSLYKAFLLFEQNCLRAFDANDLSRVQAQINGFVDRIDRTPAARLLETPELHHSRNIFIGKPPTASIPLKRNKIVICFVRLWEAKDLFIPLWRRQDTEDGWIENIKENIIKILPEGTEIVESEDKLTEANLLIALASMADFNDPNLYVRLSHRQSFLRNPRPGIQLPNYYPVITVGLLDIMRTGLDEPVQQMRKGVYQKEDHISHRLELDHRYRFFDASSWFRYISLHQDFRAKLTDALYFVSYQLDRGVYHTNQSQESLRYQLRQVGNEYIRIPKAAAYSSLLSFSSFVSESRMRLLADHEMRSLRGLDWHLLLISSFRDDYLDGGKTRPIEDYLAVRHSVTKENPFENEEQSAPRFRLDHCEDIDDALRKLLPTLNTPAPPAPAYNLVVVDYWINNAVSAGEEYGYQLFRALQSKVEYAMRDAKSEQYLRRQLPATGRLHFQPISAYATLFGQALNEMNIHHNHRYWFIEEEVDPLMQPELFRLRTYRLLKTQLQDIVHYVTGEIRQKEEGRKIGPLLPHSRLAYLLEAITADENLHIGALYQYPHLVEMGVIFKRFMMKPHRKDPFTKLIIDRFFFGLDSYAWDHLQQLIYLLTFGTFQQKQEMWEEYTLLRKIIQEYRFDHAESRLSSGDAEEALEEDYNKLFKALDAIRRYITELGKVPV